MSPECRGQSPVGTAARIGRLKIVERVWREAHVGAH